MVGMLITEVNVVYIIYVQNNGKVKWENVHQDQNGIHSVFDVMIQDMSLHHVNEF
jgi:hypothetical protein